MARTPTPVDPESDENENDTEFSAYMERLLPGCKSLTELIQAEIKKALSSSNPNPNPPDLSANSGSYLERQNAMLLSQLLKRGGRTESESILPPANEPLEENLEDLPPPAPKPKPPKTSPFWK